MHLLYVQSITLCQVRISFGHIEISKQKQRMIYWTVYPSFTLQELKDSANSYTCQKEQSIS